jgi:hypothetical protein
MADDDAGREFWSERQIASGFDNPKKVTASRIILPSIRNTETKRI